MGKQPAIANRQFLRGSSIGERCVVHLPSVFQKTVKTVKNGRLTVNKRMKNGVKTDRARRTATAIRRR
jgi:hypothetical protein